MGKEGYSTFKGNQVAESTVDKRRLHPIMRTSVNSLNSQGSAERNVGSQRQVFSPRGNANGRIKNEKVTPRLRSKGNAMLVVNDKARESMREP